MKLQSKALDIIPLKLDELKGFVHSRINYEKNQGLTISNATLPKAYAEELLDIIEKHSSAWSNNSNDFLFYTLWIMVERQSRSIVGQFTFNGLPNENDEVEVFFYIDKPHRRRGFGCEAMETILSWACKSELFRIVLIEADFDNKAAMASLKKLKFKPLPNSEDDEGLSCSTKYYKVVCNLPSTENDFDFDYLN